VFEITMSSGAGNLASAGATTPSAPMAGSEAAVVTSPRITAMRFTGSGSAIGMAMRAPAKRFPPTGSSSVRRLTGMASGSESICTPRASW
jgi:hypothetical protein